jgi:hypothetical protein
MSNTPPKPRLALAIGIIGHRPNRLPEAARDKVQADVANVLDRLSAEVKIAFASYQEFFSRGDPLLSLVSALAEGADRMAAEAALARGWALDVTLPFSATVYRTDFETPESNSTFDGLLCRARSVLVLPGQRRDETRAYESVGLTVLGQSDILLAIWDHGASGGGGGTSEMLEAAVELGVPILHVDANGKAPPRILWSELSEFPMPADTLDGVPVDDLNNGLKLLVEKLVSPPLHQTERRSLKRYIAEQFSGYNFRCEFPTLMMACGVRSMQKTDWRPSNPQILADELLKLCPSIPSGELQREPSVLALAYGWADAVGIRFAEAFRSAFVLNFLFASLAVVAVVTSLVFAHEKKYLFVSVELLLIGVVLINTMVGRLRAWHQRWFEPREVAERLRIALALWTLGTRPKSFFGREPAWTGWYARALVREQSLRSTVLDETELSAARTVLLALLADQCAYHHTTAVRMGKLERRLERFGLLLFFLTALTAVIFLLASHLVEVNERAAFFVTVLAASLPALATATYGIRVIGDFEGIARRSERTHEALKKLIDAINHDPLTLDRLRARARGAAEAMLGDVSSWRIAAESRSLNIPG